MDQAGLGGGVSVMKEYLVQFEHQRPDQYCHSRIIWFTTDSVWFLWDSVSYAKGGHNSRLTFPKCSPRNLGLHTTCLPKIRRSRTSGEICVQVSPGALSHDRDSGLKELLYMICMCVLGCLHVRTRTCVFRWMCNACTCVYAMYMCVHTCMHVCTCACVCACVYAIVNVCE